ncbi:hypothetical protein E3N88_39859 [Mikania micrantha]|uniref:No apical meristem-associated C-terminal domain-containing protein n=1 Tax=Mikania micrantha TaxID=192012 RepID=A0A5N6LKZ5_9ASTR|nr:hypothetical protein E3N88_39859 [Mikania micrantha]
MGRGNYRTNDMLSSKWRDMNLKVRKFNGIYSQKWQTRRSGQSDAMIELEAEDQYREEFNAPFSLQRSWELMRKCPNWIRLETVQSKLFIFSSNPWFKKVVQGNALRQNEENSFLRWYLASFYESAPHWAEAV